MGDKKQEVADIGNNTNMNVKKCLVQKKKRIFAAKLLTQKTNSNKESLTFFYQEMRNEGRKQYHRQLPSNVSTTHKRRRVNIKQAKEVLYRTLQFGDSEGVINVGNYETKESLIGTFMA